MRLKKEKKNNPHNHDSIISPKKKNLYFLLGPCVRATPESERLRAYLCAKRQPQDAVTLRILRSRPTVGSRCAGLGVSTGFCRGTWEDKPAHFM